MTATQRRRFTLDFERPIHELEAQLAHLRQVSEQNKLDVSAEIAAIENKLNETKRQVHENLTPWQKIQLARHPERPYSLDYIEALFTDFQELHGDRDFRDDAAIVGGTAFFEGRAVMIVAQQKGRSTKENLKRNFGCANPEGYRKALRLMKLAEKFRMPLLCFIDTPGAYPGIGAEERHVAAAIAVNIREMSELKVPIIATVIGEGGSGGALGIGVADRVLIFRNAYYSVISPEGCAAILWKDRAEAPRAAEALKITSDKLLELGIVDDVIAETIAGAHTDYAESAGHLRDCLKRHLESLLELDRETLLERRYEKYRKMGVFAEG